MASTATELKAAQALWEAVLLPPGYLSNLSLSERPDPAVNSSFKLGTAAQTSIGLAGLAAAYFHNLRTGVDQTVSVNVRHAVLEFKSESYYTVDDSALRAQQKSLFNDLSRFYRTKDNSFVRTHTNFPHHRQGILDILGCGPTKEAVADAFLRWNAIDFEEEAASRNMIAAALRSFEEWDAHPQGQALVNTPPLSIIRVGDAPKRTLSEKPTRPLEGVRVLDLTRVLAGPVCGRTLAAHGADVLLITSPNLPALPLLDIDTSRGKRTTQLDLKSPEDHARLSALVQDADVFLQAYRPEGLRNKGFGVEDVVAARPGIVYASLCAYGWDGPWKDRRGFDSIVQTTTGIDVAEAEAYAAYIGAPPTKNLIPRALPMQALDYAAGYLLAFGINAALCKTVEEGGSWEVRVSLAAVGNWIRSLGQLEPALGFGEGRPLPSRARPQDLEVVNLSVSLTQSSEEEIEPRKKMTAIRHAAVLSETPVREEEAPMRLDAHSPVWLPRDM